MAIAKVVCAACGAGLSRADARCPACGAHLEWGGPERAGTMYRCDVCGYRNPGSRTYCESCGARLFSGAEPASAPPGKEKPVKRGTPRNTTGERPSWKAHAERKRDPWQMIAGAAVVALLAVLIYVNLQSPKDQPRQSSAAPPVMPIQSAAQMADLGALEQAVRDNPNDPGPMLRLANGLHDNGVWARAIDMYKKYLVINPGDPDARVDLGTCYYGLAQADTTRSRELLALAVKEMGRAYKEHPKHQPAAFNLGVVTLSMGNLEESNTWFRRAVEIDKTSRLGLEAKRIIEQHSLSR